jgi:hypothetical protein
MEIKLNKNNKWRIDVIKDGKLIYCTAIPPTNGNRIDFINRKWAYKYNNTGPIKHGILIHIIDGNPTLIHIPEYTNTRSTRYIR